MKLEGKRYTLTEVSEIHLSFQRYQNDTFFSCCCLFYFPSWNGHFSHSSPLFFIPFLISSCSSNLTMLVQINLEFEICFYVADVHEQSFMQLCELFCKNLREEMIFIYILFYFRYVTFHFAFHIKFILQLVRQNHVCPLIFFSNPI